MAEGFDLAHIKTGASGVIPAPIETVWSLVRVFSSIGQWLLQDGFASLHSELMPGHLEGQIGSCRINTLDGQSFVEALEGLDDIKHKLRYKVVSHPNAVNPFPYAFLNFRSQFQLRKITLTNETFMEWDGSFDTELTGVVDMERAIKAQFVGGIRGLQKTFARPPSIGLAPPKRSITKPMIGATDTGSRYRSQAQSVSPPQGQPESQGYPSFQPPAFAAPQYSLQGYGAENVVPGRPPQQPQQQQQQQQPQLQPQMMQPQQLQQPQQQQPQPGASVDGMSQRGSAGSLQELRQSASVPGSREPNTKDSGGSNYSARSDAAREAGLPQVPAGQSLRVPRTSRARRNSGYSGYSST